MEGLRCLCPHVFIVCFLFESLLDITKTEYGEREQARATDKRIELKMKLLIGRGFKLGFVRIFHFSVIAYVLASFWKNLTMVLLRAHPVNPCGWSGLCRNLISRGMVPTPKSIVCFKVRLVQSHTCRREPYSPKKIHNRLCMLVAPTSTGVQAGAYSEPK